jgi:anti-sigma-K factor RskA
LIAMSHENLSELCPIYALGALDGEELREFEAHLKGGCSQCEQQVREYAELTTSIPQALPSVAPSHDLKSRLFARLDQESPKREAVDLKSAIAAPATGKPVRKSTWLPWACAAAAGIALAISFFNISRLQREISSQQARTHQLSEQLQGLRSQLEQEKAIISFLSGPSRVTMLAGTAKSPQATGKILWSAPEKKALFYASNLPAVPQGKTYQLWIIADNKPFDAGIFPVDPQGNGFLRVDSLAHADKAQKFAVTLEPAGGVPQPTGDMHLLGSL